MLKKIQLGVLKALRYENFELFVPEICGIKNAEKIKPGLFKARKYENCKSLVPKIYVKQNSEKIQPSSNIYCPSILNIFICF